MDKKPIELEHRLLAGRDQIGRGIGGSFLLLLCGPAAEAGVRRESGSLVAKLRAEGRPVEIIDCSGALLPYLESERELERAIKAERRNPAALRASGSAKGSRTALWS